MLTGKQKRYLRSLAHPLKPLLQIGKNGITDTFIDNFIVQLDAHELVKISVLPNCLEEKEDIIAELTEKANCDFVQKIGHQLIFYRPSKKRDQADRIVLPN